MKTACFIPIKMISKRVPGKNLRLLNDKKLYEYIIEHAKEADCFDDIFIDTNCPEIAEFAAKNACKVIKRADFLLGDDANGNDLLNHHFMLYPDYDLYFQLFATAPFLKPDSIKKCVEILKITQSYDSCLTVTEHKGFFWFKENPINYLPYILPRSQDVSPIIEETTGLYGIKATALKKYKCRIGAAPYLYTLDKLEATDINTQEDFELAERIRKE